MSRCTPLPHQGYLGSMNFDVPCHVNFASMKKDVNDDIRRLSTVSSVKAPPTHKFTTRWLWFWQNEFGKWTEYGNAPSNGKDGASLTSQELEKEYLENSEGIVSFNTSEHQYQIKLKIMVQKNLFFGTERKLRRRPDLQDLINGNKGGHDGDGTSRRAGSASSQDASGDSDIPPHWNISAHGDGDYYMPQLIPIRKAGSTMKEYTEVETQFLETMPGVRIKSIERIQNLYMWDSYCWKKTRMAKLHGQSPKELKLFHGTGSQYIDAICQQGFDFRLSGRSVGTLYGRGSYFAKKAKYSSDYTDGKTLFLARVIVGEYANGSSTMVRPPPKNTSNPNVLYDSCVDNTSNPQIFIVFSVEQAYPEYIIKY